AKIWFVTSRPKELAGITQNWLDNNGFGKGTLLMAGKEKFDMIWALNPSLVIDDLPDIFDKCVEAQIPCLLVAQEWNRQCDTAYRVDNIAYLDEKMLQLGLEL
ncbi:MAG: hypothetical protein Q8M94_09335, partial [Ignavibacteria bacterium]|nr:hypothetical protein [Ignavibacteria bacterium]